jgi:hypothetical protein
MITAVTASSGAPSIATRSEAVKPMLGVPARLFGG